jgi:hypothetical protein
MKKMSMSEAGKLGHIASKDKLEKQKQERIKAYYKNPNKCKECNEVIEYQEKNKIFCNSSCSAKFNNKNKTKKRLPICLMCGGKTKRFKSKYCSSKCASDYKWIDKKQKINECSKVNGIGQAKKYLREIRGNKCEMCGIDTWAGKPILLLCDHINGNSEDWNLNNLRLICSNCDATTPFYKNKNKGNGRSYRRERYKLRKSF